MVSTVSVRRRIEAGVWDRLAPACGRRIRSLSRESRKTETPPNQNGRQRCESVHESVAKRNKVHGSVWPPFGWPVSCGPHWAESAIDAAPPTSGVPDATRPRREVVSGSGLRKLIEEDWLKSLIEPLTTQSDAAGAVDGVKDGKYAFHTGGDPNPWWQVDLGSVQPIARIVVYNRLDYAPGLHNADTLVILTSDDGRQWTQRYDNQGRHFGGISGAPPLEVVFPEGELQARFVRLQIPSRQPIFFHLDEVEIYGPGDTSKNIALRQPANQSSLSQWSTAKVRRQLDFPTAACIERGRKLAAHLSQCGEDVSQHLGALDQAEERLRALPGDASEAERRRIYLETRWAVRQLVFANPLLDFDQAAVRQAVHAGIVPRRVPEPHALGVEAGRATSAFSARQLRAAVCSARSPTRRKRRGPRHRSG